MQKKLRRSETDKSISGVCGGIAEYFGISSFGVRLLFFFIPFNIVIYLILVNSIPAGPRPFKL